MHEDTFTMPSPLSLLSKPLSLLSLLYEFSESDIPTFVLPNSAFGLLASLSAPLLLENIPTPPPLLNLLLSAVPRMLLFNWTNVFVFELANQRLPDSVKEDTANKPWRPLPRGRITSEQTRRLLLVSVPVVLGASVAMGVGVESGLILLLAWMYNDLGGGDEVSRDVIIAVAYDVFLVASLRIGVLSTSSAVSPSQALPSTISISKTGYTWLGIIGLVIATTMQVQDLKDQVGDKLRNRKTWPIVLGDSFSRKWIAACIPFWSVVCVVFWKTPVLVSLVPIVLGLWVSLTVLLGSGDARAWRGWCLWQVALYVLPIWRSIH
ncbi:UbiA prenyltransferase family [Aspergillus crustosus]